MEKVIGVIALVLISSLIFFAGTPVGRGVWNSWFYAVEKVDDATSYETKKQVEDSCRAMISSYTSDKLVYEQYKDSEKEDEQSWAAQAKMRANKTASSYNNYILENNFVWQHNIPKDICEKLEYLQ